MDRRTFIGNSLATAAAAASLPSAAWARPGKSAFPRGFLWGAATAGHQIEGNNTNSDFWLLENVVPTVFSEPSGDACNSFELWRTDLDLAKALGLNSYRFSLEWSRIEPQQGKFSVAMLDHYKAVIDGCRSRGMTPIVTFSHWTVPIWFAAQGGWTAPSAPDLFARFCEKSARHLAENIGYAITLNEPNGLLIGRKMVPEGAILAQRPMLAAAAKKVGSDRFIGGPAFEFAGAMQDGLLRGHRAGFEAIKSVRSNLPVGFSLAIADDQAAGADSLRDSVRQEFYGAWLETARKDDFLGIQNYLTNKWNSTGLLPPPDGAVLNSDGFAVAPDSLAEAARYAHKACGRPIMVTEHGIVSGNDRLRVDFLPAAIQGLKRCMDEGVPVIGYMHWSLMDNFEWVAGFKSQYGLASIDRTSFKRTLKPSARIYSEIARRNSV
jgi:beta-glucosidase